MVTRRRNAELRTNGVVPTAARTGRRMVVRLGDGRNVGGGVVTDAATTGIRGEIGRQHSMKTVAMQPGRKNREDADREVLSGDGR